MNESSLLRSWSICQKYGLLGWCSVTLLSLCVNIYAVCFFFNYIDILLWLCAWKFVPHNQIFLFFFAFSASATTENNLNPIKYPVLRISSWLNKNRLNIILGSFQSCFFFLLAHFFFFASFRLFLMFPGTNCSKPARFCLFCFKAALRCYI